jgi:hypothetical protein
LLATDVSFIQLLKEAEVVACAYRYVPEGPLGVAMREIALVGVRREPLTKAFTEFERWAASGDGDAVKLTFIFLIDGGYLLCIEREPSRATHDLKGSDRTYSTILFAGSYIKKFDTRQPALEELRKYKRTFLISPFLFSAAALQNSSNNLPALNGVQPLNEVTPLLKFEADFLDEATILPGTSHYSLLKMPKHSNVSPKKNKKSFFSSLPEPKRQQPAEYFLHRARMLEHHFPVTIERIRSGRYAEMMDTLRSKGIKDWQFEQAACNLLLSASAFDGQLFYPNLKAEEFTRRVAAAIEQREERSDTPEVTRFSTGDIIAQVQLDAMALLEEEGQTILSPTLDTLQEKLAQLGLLEPPNG